MVESKITARGVASTDKHRRDAITCNQLHDLHGKFIMTNTIYHLSVTC